jgi:hypothetical protein
MPRNNNFIQQMINMTAQMSETEFQSIYNESGLQKIVNEALSGFPTNNNIKREIERLTPLQQLHIVIAPKYGPNFKQQY